LEGLGAPSSHKYSCSLMLSSAYFLPERLGWAQGSAFPTSPPLPYRFRCKMPRKPQFEKCLTSSLSLKTWCCAPYTSNYVFLCIACPTLDFLLPSATLQGNTPGSGMPLS